MNLGYTPREEVKSKVRIKDIGADHMLFSNAEGTEFWRERYDTGYGDR
jgi:hypothetical protein